MKGNKPQSGRNGEIELWRFIVAVGIVIYHSHFFLGRQGNIVGNGYLGVEFFFLLSGFFLAQSLSREKNYSQIIHLLIRKIKGFYPELFLSLCLAWCYRLTMEPTFHFSVKLLLKSVLNDYFLLQSTHIVSWSSINGPEWYLSSLVFASVLLSFYYFKIRSNLLLFFLSFFLMGWFVREYGGNPSGPGELVGYTTTGDLRALYAMGIGMSMHPIILWIQSLNISTRMKTSITLLHYVLGLGMILYFLADSHPSYDGAAVMLMASFLILVLSRQCIDSNFYNRPTFLFLGRLSLPIFLSNCFFAYHWKFVMPEGTGRTLLLVSYLAATAVATAIVMGGSALMRKYCPYFHK